MHDNDKAISGLRLVFVTHSPHFGGVEKHLIELIGALSNRHDCVIWFDPVDFYSEPLKQQSHVRVLSRPYRINHETVFRFWRDLRRLEPDVVVFSKGIADLYPWSAYVVARAVGAARVVAIEQLIADPPPVEAGTPGWKGFLRALGGWRTRYLWGKWLQGRMAHTTVAVSEAVRQRLIAGYHYPAESVVTIYNGVDISQFLQARQGSQDGGTHGVNMVCVARLSPVKRIDLLLESLALLAAHPIPWTCRIVGGGPIEEELRTKAQALGLTSRVEFTGHVQDVRPYLTQAHFAVLSSEKEGLPLSLVEIMASGLPCVVTDVGGNREIVVQGRTGLLVEFGSPERLAEAIRFMIDSPDERKRLGEEAKRFVQDRFDSRQMIESYRIVLLPTERERGPVSRGEPAGQLR